jgi:hypothetical protein
LHKCQESAIVVSEFYGGDGMYLWFPILFLIIVVLAYTSHTFEPAQRPAVEQDAPVVSTIQTLNELYAGCLVELVLRTHQHEVSVLTRAHMEPVYRYNQMWYEELAVVLTEQPDEIDKLCLHTRENTRRAFAQHTQTRSLHNRPA